VSLLAKLGFQHLYKLLIYLFYLWQQQELTLFHPALDISADTQLGEALSCNSLAILLGGSLQLSVVLKLLPVSFKTSASFFLNCSFTVAPNLCHSFERSGIKF